MYRLLLSITGLLFAICLSGQRTYTNQSVLASGSWYKIGAKEAGIYRVTVGQLSQLGINTSSLSSSSIRLYGNGGGMLPENNQLPRIDDLQENAIQMHDGGDGLFNGSDYFLFYSSGPDGWLKDSLNKRFIHQKNLYSNDAFYFITIGGTGKRIQSQNFSGTPNTTISTFDARYFFEKDSVNFLNSGKEWFGDEFSNTPGNILKRTYSTPIDNLQPGSNIIVNYQLAGRSVSNSSRFDIRINNQLAAQNTVIPISGGFFGAFVTQVAGNFTIPATNGNTSLEFTFTPGNLNAQGWLNWFEVFGRKNLSMQGNDQLLFRDWQSVGNGQMGFFTISNTTPAVEVWNITNPLLPFQVQADLNSGTCRFLHPTERLHEFVAFNGNSFLTTQNFGIVATQNLHAISPVDFLIVTHPDFLPEANRLALYHQTHDLLKTHVASTVQIFNEFASGAEDPTAIRDYVKMIYDRAGGDSTKRPKYLLLFGDASFDYKNRLQHDDRFVPPYESPNSTDPLITHTTDDFYGYLDDLDDITQVAPAPLLDIGIGRLPVNTINEARQVVDKIINYTASNSFGPWRNNISFIADDEDNNLHLNDAESVQKTAAGADDALNNYKIYLDAYRQETGNGGSRYPLVNQAITNQMQAGNLIWNYNGHGGYNRLAEEAILEQAMVANFNNENKLPLFITATCDFAPFDNPTLPSLGEYLLTGSAKGAIALMTTTRPVFAFSNKIMNENYLQIALRPQNGLKPRLGDAVKRSKNFTYQSNGDILNNRKFILLGDPAMSLNFPKQKIALTTLNGQIINPGKDTLKALGNYVLSGEIQDTAKRLLTQFNGTLYATVFDKVQSINTIANDPGSMQTVFQSQTNALFKGKVKVSSGKFNLQFIVPKDINNQFGNGRISLYANDEIQDAAGVQTNFVIGGNSGSSIQDKTGPGIRAFLNDEKFVNGGITSENPQLIVTLSDSSGINTTGAGIGHDITAVIDGNQANALVLNDFYEGNIDSYQKGTIRFQLPLLADGPHTITIKAWDVLNNSSELTISCTVYSSKELKIDHVLNYPNPFTTSTHFWFEHNQPGAQLKLGLRILTISGKIVFESKKEVFTTGTRENDLFWDGKDQFGNKLARGVYIYELTVQAANQEKKSSYQKLYLL